MPFQDYNVILWIKLYQSFYDDDDIVNNKH